jgi:hypothetical protein
MFIPMTKTRAMLIFIIAVVLSATPTFGQVKNTGKLSRVPANVRDKLIQRLELFVQCDKARDFNKQFDLLSPSFLRRDNFTRQTYVEFRRKEIRGSLLSVSIDHVHPHLREGYVDISISAQTLYKGRNASDTWIFTAYLQDGEWFFDYNWVDI